MRKLEASINLFRDLIDTKADKIIRTGNKTVDKDHFSNFRTRTGEQFQFQPFNGCFLITSPQSEYKMNIDQYGDVRIFDKGGERVAELYYDQPDPDIEISFNAKDFEKLVSLVKKQDPVAFKKYEERQRIFTSDPSKKMKKEPKIIDRAVNHLVEKLYQLSTS